MLPHHVHDVDGKILVSDHNVGKVFVQNSDNDLLPLCTIRVLISITFVFRAGILSSSDAFTGCFEHVPHELPRVLL